MTKMKSIRRLYDGSKRLNKKINNTQSRRRFMLRKMKNQIELSLKGIAEKYNIPSNDLIEKFRKEYSEDYFKHGKEYCTKVIIEKIIKPVLELHGIDMID